MVSQHRPCALTYGGNTKCALGGTGWEHEWVENAGNGVANDWCWSHDSERNEHGSYSGALERTECREGANLGGGM